MRRLWFFMVTIGVTLVIVLGYTIFFALPSVGLELGIRVDLVIVITSLTFSYLMTITNVFLMYKSNAEIAKSSQTQSQMVSKRILGYQKIWIAFGDYFRQRKPDYELIDVQRDLHRILEDDGFLFFCSDSVKKCWNDLRCISATDDPQTYEDSLSELVQCIETEVII